MSSNGLQSFAFHRHEQAAVADAIRPLVGDLPPQGNQSLAGFDPEAVARRYLNEAFASRALPTFNKPELGDTQANFRTLGTEVVPLTGTRVVKFRQEYCRIPVYGSLVTVELDENNELLALNSALGMPPEDLDPVAKRSPSQAMEAVRQRAGDEAQPLDTLPRLVFYFNEPNQRWHLAYLVQNVTRSSTADRGPGPFDYLVDAHDGSLIVELPRVQSVGGPDLGQERQPIDFRSPDRPGKAQSIAQKSMDGVGKLRQFKARKVGDLLELVDEELNVHTYDYGFGDVDRGEGLPGKYVAAPPEPWDAAAVSAHANAVEVVLFLRRVLRREGLDNRGGPLISSVNCCCAPRAGNRTWNNAAWIGTQMVYGQRMTEHGEFRSYAVAKDVVAHEIIHGLTDHTARLEYAGMSGALNESYSDIFGIIMSNIDNPDVGSWNWEMGEDLEETGIPIRDMSQPSRYEQPEHMNDYVFLSVGPMTDWGGVHVNSGIHNKAAHHLLTSKDVNGNFMFDPREVAALFYLSLTQHLSRTSRFIDSRRGVELAGRSFFRRDPRLDEKLEAIGNAFEAVGITSNLGVTFEPNRLSS
ncbi:MAG TPA: M4 family metallopeptidase [Myxococcaceae bacterium]|jgi:Zn-dependent metalloprotease